MGNISNTPCEGTLHSIPLQKQDRVVHLITDQYQNIGSMCAVDSYGKICEHWKLGELLQSSSRKYSMRPQESLFSHISAWITQSPSPDHLDVVQKGMNTWRDILFACWLATKPIHLGLASDVSMPNSKLHRSFPNQEGSLTLYTAAEEPISLGAN